MFLVYCEQRKQITEFAESCLKELLLNPEGGPAVFSYVWKARPSLTECVEYFDCQGACYLICCLLFVLLTNSQQFPEEVKVVATDTWYIIGEFTISLSLRCYKLWGSFHVPHGISDGTVYLELIYIQRKGASLLSSHL